MDAINNKNKSYKLTEARIKTLRPLDKPYTVPGNYPGLELLINLKGTMTWKFQYRVKSIPYPLRKRIGRYPTIGIKEAELRAKKIERGLFDGVDPREQEKIDIGNLTLKDGLNKYIKEELIVPYYKPKTIQGFKSIMKVWVERNTNDADILQRFTTMKDIGHIKISKITNKMILEHHQAISKRAPYVANRFVQYGRLFWNMFVKLPDNPFVVPTKKLNEEKEYLDFLTPTELQRVMFYAFRKDGNNGRLLESHYKKFGLRPVSCTAIAFMLTTGRRTSSEGSSLEWNNYKAGFKPMIQLEQTKTSKKNKKTKFRLGKKAVEILQTIQRDKFNNMKSKFWFPVDDIRNKYIWPSNDYGRRLGKKKKGSTPYVSDLRKTWKKLLALAGVERALKLYSTRHTFASNYYINTKDVKGGAEALGTTVQTFNKYAKILDDQMVDNIDSIEFDRVEIPKLKEVK